MNHTAEHNIYPVKPAFFYEDIDTVTIKDVLSFEQISEMLNIPIADLKFLNPTFKKGIIPTTKNKKYTLRLPYEFVGAFIDNEQEIYDYKTKKGIERL